MDFEFSVLVTLIPLCKLINWHQGVLIAWVSYWPGRWFLLCRQPQGVLGHKAPQLLG